MMTRLSHCCLLLVLLVSNLALKANGITPAPAPASVSSVLPPSPTPNGITPAPASVSVRSVLPPSPTPTPSHTPTPSPTPTPSHTPTPTPSPTPTPTPTPTPQPSTPPGTGPNVPSKPGPVPDGKSKSSQKLSGGQKGGIAIGVILGVGFLPVAGFVYITRRNNIKRSRLAEAGRMIEL